jgi:hypothetical protein
MKPYKKQFKENSFVKSEAYWINPYGDILAVDTNHKKLLRPTGNNLEKYSISQVYKNNII